MNIHACNSKNSNSSCTIEYVTNCSSDITYESCQTLTLPGKKDRKKEKKLVSKITLYCGPNYYNNLHMLNRIQGNLATSRSSYGQFPQMQMISRNPLKTKSNNPVTYLLLTSGETTQNTRWVLLGGVTYWNSNMTQNSPQLYGATEAEKCSCPPCPQNGWRELKQQARIYEKNKFSC